MLSTRRVKILIINRAFELVLWGGWLNWNVLIFYKSRKATFNGSTGRDDMNKYSMIFVATFTIATSVSSAVAQEKNASIDYKSGDPSAWPAKLDAVVAAPDNHLVLMENAEVRVLEVTVSPSAVEPLHSHRWPSVLYIMSAGDFLDRDSDGNVIFDTRTLDAPLTLPLTMWKGPEAPHSVENLSEDQELRLIRVELKT